MKFQKKLQAGLSLLEILVVITIFAGLGIMTTRAIFLTLQGSKKSESLVRVRENLDYSLGVVGRQLRNADNVSECPLSDPGIINYIDQDGNSSSFSCVNMGSTDPYLASGSARLTSNVVKITTCNFSCTPGQNANPHSIIVNLEAEDTASVGIQNSKVSTSLQMSLRNY